MSNNNSKTTTSTSTTISIQVQQPDPQTDPLIVSFPTSSSLEHVKFTWKPVSEKRPKRGRIVEGQNDHCKYQAQNNQGRNHDGRGFKQCIGVHDKLEQTLTICQATQRGTVYEMKQSVLRYQPEQHMESTSQAATDRHRVLFESFGSSKKRKVLNSQRANRVNVDSVVGAHQIKQALESQTELSQSNLQRLKQTKSGIKTESLLEASHAEARMRLLPPFDETATQPHMVYNGQDICGNDVWHTLTGIVKACLKKQDQYNGSYIQALQSRGWWAPCVTNLLHSLPPTTSTTTSTSSTSQIHYQVKCAILLNHWIQLESKMGQSSILRGSPEELASKYKIHLTYLTRFLECFATHTTTTHDEQEEQYIVTKGDKDKFLLHSLLLYLIAAGGLSMKLSTIQEICNDLKMEPSHAANLYRAAACTVTSSSNKDKDKDNTKGRVYRVALHTPVTFPNPKRGGRKRTR